MSTKVLPLWQRLQFQVGATFTLIPNNKDVYGWRKWLFDPCGGVTRIGQELRREHLPGEMDVSNVCYIVDDKILSRVLWVHCAIRILGLDVGVAFMYIVNPREPR